MAAFRFLLLTALLTSVLASGVCALEPMSEKEMDGVQAGSGISLALSDVEVYRHDGYLAYRDTSGSDSRIELEDTASLYIYQSLAPIYIQVYENQDGLPMVGMEALAGQDGEDAIDMGMYSDSKSYSFRGQQLGGMTLDNFHTEEFAMYLAPADALDGLNDAEGVAFHLESRSGWDEFKWEYQDGQDNGEAFVLGGMKAAESFDTEGNPQGRFTIGELDPRDENDADNNPASFQALQDSNGNPYLRMNLPMQGSLRAEQVNLAGNDLGPIRIDDLQINHLEIDFNP